eukprot:12162-Eustigmatos_ZCMA.PRE.1
MGEYMYGADGNETYGSEDAVEDDIGEDGRSGSESEVEEADVLEEGCEGPAAEDGEGAGAKGGEEEDEIDEKGNLKGF